MVDREIHLCDTCGNAEFIPECMPSVESGRLEFGEGVGHDNIIRCSNHSIVNAVRVQTAEYNSDGKKEQILAREESLENEYRKKMVLDNETQQNRSAL